jgi:Ser/Thr protein kinase RdoA (MazF antagonist)
LNVIIPRFHDVRWRFEQFTQALENDAKQRLLRADELIRAFQKRSYLVEFYDRITQQPEFKLRVMHHDCKMSNLLLDEKTALPLCPIDWDTLMPGYYFSDLGDLIRSLSGTHPEDYADTHRIGIRKDFYRALLEGYLEGMGQAFTPSEKKLIHHAGPLMIYMQGLRFLTDYLNGDVYYKTTYPQQNFDRASNQHALLTRLETFLLQEYDYTLEA